MSDANGGQAPTPDRLEAQASQMAKDLEGLVSKLKDLGQAGSEELKNKATEAIAEQFKALQGKLDALKTDHQELIATVDESVKAHPYLYILGALGLGVLLGKAMRS